jgi:two-component system sensor histidine kinase DegS
VTTSQRGTQTGEPGSAAPAGAYEGLHDSDVQDLYDAVRRVVDKHLGALRRLQTDAEGRVRLAIVEQQQLERFLDELSYRLRFLDENTAGSAGVAGLHTRLEAQQRDLQGRQAGLREAQARLEHLAGRIGWLLRQTGLSAQRIEERADAPADGDPWALLLRAQLIQGQEAERSRLAREIHDGPAQALTNTLLRLQFLEGVLQTRPEDAAQELVHLRASVRESLRDVRRFIFNLRPASLKEVGVVGTLQRMIAEYREYTGLDVRVTLPESMELGQDQELVVFRVVQEALHNVQKHAVAGRVEVEVARGSGGWVITVADDGRGFEPAAQPGQSRISSGLVSMRERAAIVGGSLEVQSAPGHGTRLTLTIPVPDTDLAQPNAATRAVTPQEDRS